MSSSGVTVFDDETIFPCCLDIAGLQVLDLCIGLKNSFSTVEG